MIYIEIAIVILMVFMLLSLIVTAVTELIASFFKLRARFLKRELARILSDNELREKFYKNRLLLGTCEDANGSKDKLLTGCNHPSYIAPKAFAKVLLLALSEKNGQNELAEQQPSSLRDTAKKINSEPLRQLLLGLINNTEKSFSELEKDIAAWYDSATDRLSGYFKRQQQLTSFIVGFLLAAVFNIDILTLAVKAYSDAAFRAELVTIGEIYVAEHSELIKAAAEKNIKEIKEIKDLEVLFKDLKGIALGWPDGFELCKAVKHVPGWILAALASILGAPFWFDLLSRFIQIRGTGRKPQPVDVSERDSEKSAVSK